MSCFVASLRGNEEFIMDAAGLRHHIGKIGEGPLAHVVINLMGIFKGETGSRHHLQAIVNETASELKVRWWLERLSDEFISQGEVCERVRAAGWKQLYYGSGN